MLKNTPEANQNLFNLLDAVAHGDEDSAQKIITSHPELLLDTSAIVTDCSGKKIENLTPLQSAICAGDVEMVRMMKEVLLQKQQQVLNLGFEPEIEIQRQFMQIYPNGDIDAVEAVQKFKAEEFKTSNLHDIFRAINLATTAEIRCILISNVKNTMCNPLDTAIRDFREQFSATSRQEQIFNPFYLLKAFEFFNEQFDNFIKGSYSSWLPDPDGKIRRDFFWRQVIGYIQCLLPACYIQAFANNIYYVAVCGEKLKRDFELVESKGTYLDSRNFGIIQSGLGYKFAYAPGTSGSRGGIWYEALSSPNGTVVESFQKLLQTKKSGLEDLFTHPTTAYNHNPGQPGRCLTM